MSVERTRLPHVSVLAALLLTLAASWPALADLEGQIRVAITDAKIGNTQFAVSIVDLDEKEVVVSINQSASMIPASNLKLLSSATALHTLGGDFAFRTELRAIDPATWNATFGQAAAVDGAVLVVVGDGDPGFGDSKLLSEAGLDADKLVDIWVDAAKRAGIRRVSQLIVDDRVFDRLMVHDSWPDDQLNNWYCAPVAGINFNDNCLDLYAKPTRAGSPPTVRVVPDVAFLNIPNKAVTGQSNSFWVHRDPGTNKFSFRGIVDREHTVPVHITLHDPPMFFGKLFAHRLIAAGISVRSIARPRNEVKLPAGQLIHAVQTPLASVITRCNKDSQNLFAEALLKRAGHAHSGKPGSWANGGDAVKAFLAARVSPAIASDVVIGDGSGLARTNRVTARALAATLDVIHHDPKLAPAFVSSLAVAGEDGTLKRRFRKDTYCDVLGKSGYISGVSALSGYVYLPIDENDPNAKRQGYAFSILLNGFRHPLNNFHMKRLQEKIVRLIDDHAEAEHRAVQLGG